MPFKFEKLEVWQKALDYIDQIYDLANLLPRSEDFNLRSQIIRAATSVSLNIAEGSIGQTDAEQARFLGMAIRSLVETVACQHIIARRKLLADPSSLRHTYRSAESLVAMLHSMRKHLVPEQTWLREEHVHYTSEGLDAADPLGVNAVSFEPYHTSRDEAAEPTGKPASSLVLRPSSTAKES